MSIRELSVAAGFGAFLLLGACGGKNAAGGGPTTAAAGSTASAANAQAQSRSAEMDEADEHRMHHHGGMLALVAMSMRELDLAPDQRAAVEKIRSDLTAKMAPARDAEKSLVRTLAEGVAKGSVDRAKTDGAIEKLVSEAQGLHEATFDAVNRLHATLNAQQRSALVDKIQLHWERWKEANGRDEQNGGPHRSGHLLALVKQLGITQAEAEQIQSNFRELMKATKGQEHEHKEVREHLQAFGAAFKTDNFDAKTFASAKSANAHLARWGATRLARFLEAAAPVLTPEQRTKLANSLRDRATP